MTDIRLQVPEVHCDHCKSSLEGAVASMRGVHRVEVDVANATIDVGFDDGNLDLGAIKAAIEEQGYAVFG